MRLNFPLGRLVVTQELLQTAIERDMDPMQYVRRHASGDWGDLSDENKAQNVHALVNEGALWSSYLTRWTFIVWVVTEWDRSRTTVTLPQEYYEPATWSRSECNERPGA